MSAGTDDETLVALPGVGRVYRGQRLVRLGDASPGGRLRFDALVRYLQDVANDDTRDAGFDDVMGWVVRRTVIEVAQFPVYLEPVVLSTWCSGIGGRWAERRVQVTGEMGGLVETATLWVHLDPGTMRPKPLPPSFHALFGPSALDRVVRARLHHPDTPTGDGDGLRHPFPLRFTDFDVLDHVNNAVHWEAVEEELARRRELRAPLRAEIEHRAPIEPGAEVEVVIEDAERSAALWLRHATEGTVYATATIAALPS
ncbi:MAG TPA: acyl-ACP thioesterase domain-containing protein [Acidimicrobiales bacterium]|nr:acyl-ACP thioesterase domain-containing protein [Acidimicrobiales bacterium]